MIFGEWELGVGTRLLRFVRHTERVQMDIWFVKVEVKVEVESGNEMCKKSCFRLQASGFRLQASGVVVGRLI
jgi:hypothetical protein